jgi:pyruvate/2-oxoglutarate dehydrogenase complex dihydrolipoamide acyltransferase (E2) component
MRLYYTLPQWVRLFLIKQILRNPHRSKAMMGTAIITSAGTAGHVSGWIIPKAMHNLCFALGPIAKKPWVVANRIEIRDILHLTVLVDHDVVDGAPAARFASRLLAAIQQEV